jgi:hypothetical protein
MIKSFYNSALNQFYKLEALLYSVDHGCIWKSSDSVNFKNIYKEDCKQTSTSDTVNTKIIKKDKITMKDVIDHIFRQNSLLSNIVIQMYQTIDPFVQSDHDLIRMLNIYTNLCIYNSTSLNTSISSLTKKSDYVLPVFTQDIEVDTDSDSETDSETDSDSETESLELHIAEINQTWNKFSKYCTSKLIKKMDLNLPSQLKKKIKNAVETRTDQIDDEPDRYSQVISDENRKFYTTALTLRSWIDELRTGNCVGMNADVDIQSYLKGRYNISLASVPRLMGSTTEFFDGIKTRGFTDIMSNTLCLDGVFGDSNVVIPLFISNLNWKIAKHYVDPISNMIVNNSYLVADDNAWRIYYILLLDMFNCMISGDLDRDSVRRFFALWF